MLSGLLRASRVIAALLLAACLGTPSVSLAQPTSGSATKVTKSSATISPNKTKQSSDGTTQGGTGGGGYGPRDLTPPRLSGVSVAGANASGCTGNWIRSNGGLKSLTLTFSEAVALPVAGSAGAPAIRAFIGGANPTAIALTATPGATPDTLIVTLDSAIHTGLVTLIADYSIVDSAGNALDGEVANPESLTLPSGDGLPGGQSVLRFKVLSGDVNRDGVVDGNDLGLVLNGFDTYSADADLDGNGVVDSEDVNAVVSNFDATLAKDDGARPTVTAITPDPTKNLIADIGSVSVSFNEPVNLSMISPRGLFLVNDPSASQGGGGGSSVPIPASGVSLSPDGKTATFTFSSPVSFCGAYRIGLSQALADTSGSLAVAPTATALSGLLPPADPFITATPVVTGTEFFTFTGTADRAAKVRVTSPAGSIEAPVAANGTFTAQIQLPADVLATVYFTAVSPCNIASSPSSRRISFDASAPNVFIDFPVAGAALTVDKTNVIGRVGDEFSGFAGITVTVNGTPAQVNVGGGNNGTFIATDVPVNASGSTTFTVVATDIVGNQRTTSINVTKSVIKPTDYTIIPISGDGQTGGVKSVLATPLVVKLSKPDGSPLPGKVVTFDITRSDGQLLETANGTPGASGPLKLQVFTDASGLARAYWRLGSDAGSGNNRVNVTSQDLVGTVSFSASGIASAAGRIVVGDHDYQKAQAGAQLPQPLRIFVTDGDTGNGVADVPVTFTVTQGDGLMGNGEESITLITDPTGHIDATFFLGVTPGVNTVEATFPGNPGLPATFTATGLERNDAAFTTLEGIVQDNAGRAIGGAVITLKTTLQFASGPSLFTLGPKSTDVNGKFAFTKADLPANALDTDLPAGPAKLLADARNPVTLNGVAKPVWSFPYVGYEMVLVKGAVNSLPQPIYLPEMDPRNEVLYDGTKDVVLKVVGIDGLEFKVKAGSMTRENGTRPTPADPEVLRLNQVHFDEVPMPIPDGSAFPFAWTFQPKNARFNPPVQVTLPNLTGLAPGSAATIVQWNNDTASFQGMGTGKVSADGATITTEAGTGITVAGWGGVTPPPPPTGNATNGCVSGAPSMLVGPSPCEFDRRLFPPGFEVDEYFPSIVFSELPESLDPRTRDEFKRILALQTPDFIKDGINAAGANLQTLESGVYQYNFDEYRTRIERLPQGMTAQGLLRAFAQNPNGFAQSSVFDFLNVFQPQFSGSPQVGSTYRIDFLNVRTDLGTISAATGGVVVIDQSETSIVVETFGLDQSLPRTQHPVSGRREFFVKENSDGSVDFGTRGIDRPSGELSYIPFDGLATATFGFSGQSADWQALLNSAATRINRGDFGAGGSARFLDDEKFAWRLSSATRPLSPPLPFPFGPRDVTNATSHVFYRLVTNPSLEEPNGAVDYGMLRDGVKVRAGVGATLYLYDPISKQGGVLSAASSTDAMTVPLSAIPDEGPDADNDGLSEYAELLAGTNDGVTDTDGDGVSDLDELLEGTNPRVKYLSSSFTASIDGRTIPVRNDGGFIVRGVRSDRGLKQLEFVGSVNGEMRFGRSDYFDVIANQTRTTSSIAVRSSPFPSISGIAIDTSTSIATPGQTLQLMVSGLMSDGTQADVTARSAGTTYESTDPSVMSVNTEGLLTAHRDGTVFIIATNESATAVKRVDVAASTFTTTVTGVAMLPSGSPAAGASITTLPFGGSATADSTGGFSISPVVPVGNTNIKASANVTVGNQTYTGLSALLAITPGGITDAGLLKMVAPYAGPLFPEQTLPAGTNPYSVGIEDVDGDGRPDLVVANYSSDTVSVLRSNGNATFADKVDYATGSRPISIAIGDLDGDGRPDLAVANYNSNTVSVLRNLGNGTFSDKVDYATGSYPRFVAIGDLDGDGRHDLAVANQLSSSVSVLKNTTGITFAARVDFGTGSGPVGLAIGDLNGDGKPDLAVAGVEGVSVLRNATPLGGNVAFATKVGFATENSYRFVVMGDLEGDGKADIAVGTSDLVSIFRNLGDGNFAPKVDYVIGYQAGAGSASIGDLDGDGKPDLAVANYSSNSVSVFRNLGNGTFAAKVEHVAGSNPISLALGDLDSDGKPDLAVANYSSNSVSLLRNLGNGTFASRASYAIGNGPCSVAIEDLDVDGRKDIAVANRNSNSVSVLWNAGNGMLATKVDYATGAGPNSVAVGDLDGDQKLDLAVANISSNTVSVLRNLSNRTFASRVDFATQAAPISVAAGDLDGDGRPDLVVANVNSSTVSVLRNTSGGNGTITFAAKVDYATGVNPSFVSIGDLDGDGRSDLAATNESGDSVSVLRNLGDGTFAARVDYATGSRPLSVVVGDVDGDGKPELAVANFGRSPSVGNTASVLRNLGNGTFAAKVDYTTGNSPRSISIGDLNGDGKPDLAVANNSSNSVSVLRNLGNGTFSAKADYATGSVPRAVAAGDIDGDGRPDLVIANSGTFPSFADRSVSILRNQSGGGASPLTVPLNRGFATNKSSSPPFRSAVSNEGELGVDDTTTNANASANTSLATTTRNAGGLTSTNASTNGNASVGTTEGANSGANANASNTNSGTKSDTVAIPLGTTTVLGMLGGKQSYVNASAADGSVAVGWSETAEGWRAPFIWTPRTGMRPLADLTHPRDLVLLPFGSSEAVALEGPDGMNAGGDPAASLPTMRVCVRVSRPGVECAPAPMVRVRLGVDSRADVNGDGVIDSADLDLIRKHGRAYSIVLDVNLDGKIDNEDLKAVRERVGK
jgi:hypothetical protein